MDAGMKYSPERQKHGSGAKKWISPSFDKLFQTEQKYNLRESEEKLRTTPKSTQKPTKMVSPVRNFSPSTAQMLREPGSSPISTLCQVGNSGKIFADEGVIEKLNSHSPRAAVNIRSGSNSSMGSTTSHDRLSFQTAVKENKTTMKKSKPIQVGCLGSPRLAELKNEKIHYSPPCQPPSQPKNVFTFSPEVKKVSLAPTTISEAIVKTATIEREHHSTDSSHNPNKENHPESENFLQKQQKINPKDHYFKHKHKPIPQVSMPSFGRKMLQKTESDTADLAAVLRERQMNRRTNVDNVFKTQNLRKYKK